MRRQIGLLEILIFFGNDWPASLSVSMVGLLSELTPALPPTLPPTLPSALLLVAASTSMDCGLGSESRMRSLKWKF